MITTSEPETTVSNEHLEVAEQIIGTIWIPIRWHRRDLAIRIAEVIAHAEREGERKGYDAAKNEKSPGRDRG